MKLLILFVYPTLIFAYKYFAELENPENPFSPCENYPDLLLSTYLDYSNVTFHSLENNTLHVQGKMEFNKHLNDIVGVQIEALKKKRGVYVNTIFSINRNDYCKSLFNPVEYWYPMVEGIAEEERKCPLQKGMFYNLNLYTDLEFDFPEKSGEGQYKARFQFFYKTTKELIACVDIFTYFYRL